MLNTVVLGGSMLEVKATKYCDGSMEVSDELLVQRINNGRDESFRGAVSTQDGGCVISGVVSQKHRISGLLLGYLIAGLPICMMLLDCRRSTRPRMGFYSRQVFISGVCIPKIMIGL
ncbi:hypothetical protein L211DRAFT_835508 [Terfezia boudieri ATCC MYA-4762]|uniref:Uncharacterized protein n=1 Tax=Terfezia boudieri ATCC MYA-4762 TaxID=1051890 RepID=A0A3N4M897_9PEZI|nr:hypothetical protein L211DRAFT_835508 [Terfezia boudieri ATCC MYA-4762]